MLSHYENSMSGAVCIDENVKTPRGESDLWSTHDPYATIIPAICRVRDRKTPHP